VGNLMCIYICSVIVQVIITVMKKTAFVKKGIRGERREGHFHFKEVSELLSLFKLRGKIAMIPEMTF